MSRSIARALGALILGVALSAPFVVLGQTPAPAKAAPAATPAAAPAAAPAATPTPPVPAKDSLAVPGWNKPPEQWNLPSEQPQYASIPGREKIGIAFLAIMGFYIVKGTIRVKEPPTGRLIERFNPVERASHWTMAITFVILALTGAVILWGKYLILPWLGYNAFSWVQIVGKNVHNFVGPLFIFSLITTFLLFLKDNFFTMWDVKWFTSLGGWLRYVPSYKFNAGEKMVFWGGLVGLGIVIGATGIILDFPNWGQLREFMQVINVIHAIAAVFFICMIMGHAYMGTLGLEGAFKSMETGYVDEQWAKEEHELWYNEIKEGKRPEHFVTPRTQPATGD